MPEPALRADCSACAALCCFLLPFDKSAEFGFDKAASAPCPHLSSAMRCQIHYDLQPSGFSGCVAFDCHGAGQRVTQEVFSGHSWRDDPGLAAPMENAFRAMRKLHEAALMLRKAADLPLTPHQQESRIALLATLDFARKRDAIELASFEAGPALGKVRRFLGSLKPSHR